MNSGTSLWGRKSVFTPVSMLGKVSLQREWAQKKIVSGPTDCLSHTTATHIQRALFGAIQVSQLWLWSQWVPNGCGQLYYLSFNIIRSYLCIEWMAVCGLCCGWGPCWGLWFVRSSETMLNWVTLCCHCLQSHGSFFFSGVGDHRLTVETGRFRRLLW